MNQKGPHPTQKELTCTTTIASICYQLFFFFCYLPGVNRLLERLKPDRSFVLLGAIGVVVEGRDGRTNGVHRRRRIHLYEKTLFTNQFTITKLHCYDHIGRQVVVKS